VKARGINVGSNRIRQTEKSTGGIGILIIGELINAARRPVREAVLNRNRQVIQELAANQVRAGADYLDVNVAAGLGDVEREAADIEWAIGVIREVTDKPLAIDTTDPTVLERGLQAAGPGAMVNSISLESNWLEPFLQLAARYEALAIVLPVSDAGIPRDPEERLANCRELFAAAQRAGMAANRLYFDPLVMPLSVAADYGRTALETLAGLRRQGWQTTMGLSNISYGLPARKVLNRAFLSMAVAVGLDSVILDPLDRGLRAALVASLALAGQDPMCAGYLRAYRRGELA
jgi:5-methyltetrahydrofolate--homocysteine methyltransferase